MIMQEEKERAGIGKKKLTKSCVVKYLCLILLRNNNVLLLISLLDRFVKYLCLILIFV